jgi:hypothetical protein
MRQATDTAKFLEIVDNWLPRNDFQRLLRWEKCYHWLSYQTLHENNYSDFLAWVLSPNEGHGLGDYFIRRLLLSLWDDQENVERLMAWGWFTSTEIEYSSFANATVAREVRTRPELPGSPRIDLVVSDTANNLLLVIERKDGSKVSSTQLGEYAEWADNLAGRYIRQLWLVADSYESDHVHQSEDWLSVNDDWLIGSLDLAVESNAVPPYLKQQFKDFSQMLAASALSESGTLYTELDKDFARFVSENKEELAELPRLYLPECEIRFADIDKRTAIERVYSQLHSIDGATIRAVGLAVKYHHVLNRLASDNRLAHLGAIISAQFPGRFCVELKVRRNEDHNLALSLTRFASLKRWPIVVSVESYARVCDETPRSATEFGIKFYLQSNVDLGDSVAKETWRNSLEQVLKHKIAEGQQFSKLENVHLDFVIENDRVASKLVAILNVLVRIDESLK